MSVKGEDGGDGLVVKYEGDVPQPPIPNTNYASFLLSILEQHGDKVALVSYKKLCTYILFSGI